MTDGVQLPQLRRLSTYKARPTTWLLDQRIPYGHVTVLCGAPGEGKSTLLMRLAGDLTVKRTPAIYIGTEDDIASTVVPRFAATAGDADQFYTFGEEIDPTFPEHAQYLEAAVKESGAGLVVVDPIAAHLSPELNTSNDHSLRQGLRPLARIAQRTGAAVVIVMHPRKSREGSVLSWLAGGAGFGGLVRSALLFGMLRADVDDLQREHLRYLFHVKSNLSLLQQPMVCEISTQYVTVDDQELETSSLRLTGHEDTGARPEELR